MSDENLTLFLNQAEETLDNLQFLREFLPRFKKVFESYPGRHLPGKQEEVDRVLIPAQTFFTLFDQCRKEHRKLKEACQDSSVEEFQILKLKREMEVLDAEANNIYLLVTQNKSL